MGILLGLAEKFSTMLAFKQAVMIGSEHVIRENAQRGLLVIIFTGLSVYAVKLASEAYALHKMLYNCVGIMIMAYVYWMMLGK